MKPARSPRTRRPQFERMIQFIEQNKLMISNKTSSTDSSESSQRVNELWEELAQVLNSSGMGPQKTANKWRRAFVEYLSNTRKHVRLLKAEQSRSHGYPRMTPVQKPLNKLEHRLLNLITSVGRNDEDIEFVELPVEIVDDTFSESNPENQQLEDVINSEIKNEEITHPATEQVNFQTKNSSVSHVSNVNDNIGNTLDILNRINENVSRLADSTSALVEGFNRIATVLEDMREILS